MARQDRLGRGGDNRAFDWYGFPAVVFRESRENFARQHGPLDTFEGTSPAYLARNARVNAAAAASLGLAPPAPAVTTRFGGVAWLEDDVFVIVFLETGEIEIRRKPALAADEHLAQARAAFEGEPAENAALSPS